MNDFDYVDEAWEAIDNASATDAYLSMITSISDLDDFLVKLKTLILWAENKKYMTKDD
jgi:hypothetical protein